MGFAIEYSADAVADLAAMRAFDRTRIVNAVLAGLSHEPAVRNRHRKPVFHTPEILTLGATWELRIGDYRVLYDIVPTARVLIIRVIYKGSLTLAQALVRAAKKEEDQ